MRSIKLSFIGNIFKENEFKLENYENEYCSLQPNTVSRITCEGEYLDFRITEILLFENPALSW